MENVDCKMEKVNIKEEISDFSEQNLMFIAVKEELPEFNESVNEFDHHKVKDASFDASKQALTCTLKLDNWLKRTNPQESHSAHEPLTKKTLTLKTKNGRVNPDWEMQFFVTEKETKPYCLLCNKILSVNKKYNVRRHYVLNHSEIQEKRFPLKSEKRKQEIEKIKTALENMKILLSTQEEQMKNFLGEGDIIEIATLRCAWILAKRKKSFADVEILKETLFIVLDALSFDFSEKEKKKLIKRVRMMPFSRQTAARRTVDLAENIEEQLKQELSSCLAFSLALYESTDMRETAQLCMWIRLLTENFEVQEELLALSPLKDHTRGCYILKAATKEFEKFRLSFEKLSSFATSGSPAMKGKMEGFSSLFESDEEVCVPSFHCIIQQESLCCELCKSGSLHDVMEEVIKILNFLRAHAFNHCQFMGYLEEVEAEYGDLIYFNAVRCLSHGNVLKTFTELLPEIKDFLELKDSERPILSDPQWLTRLYFLTEVTKHLNILNLKLKGKSKSIANLFKEVQVFRLKLDMWIEQIASGDCTHFSLLNCPELNGITDFEELHSYLVEMKSQFQKRFTVLDEYEPCFKFLRLPLEFKSQDVSELSRICPISVAQFQEELIELKVNYAHHEDTASLEFWRRVYECQNYPEISGYVAKLWAMFGSTWLCESTFSFMKLLKSKPSATISDINLESELRCVLTEYTPQFSRIVKSVKYHFSH